MVVDDEFIVSIIINDSICGNDWSIIVAIVITEKKMFVVAVVLLVIQDEKNEFFFCLIIPSFFLERIQCKIK